MSSRSTRLSFRVEAEATGSRARATRFRTLHNEVITPIFMPVGTQATVRGQTVDTLESVGAQVLLANTYHLLLRPGPEVFRKMGGIHRFANWKKSVLTDSGGFQIFSLPNSRRMTEEGAEFSSYIDGTRILLSPEVSIETQKAIGSDIMMVLDQCIPSTSEHKVAVEAMNLTHRWAVRSLAARGDSPQSMFGIVQGACFEDLRRQSADFLTQLPFDGFAIGGLAVGESKAMREDFCELSASLLPRDLPRYLMGVGTPIDLLEAVHRGVDMFDCIIPTAFAQRGVIFTSRGKVQLRRSVYKFVEDKLDPECSCPACTNYSTAYLHHLTKAEEVLGWHLLGLHNLTFYMKLMREMREAILNDTFLAYYKRMRPILSQQDEDNPVSPPPRKHLSKAEKRAKELQLGKYEVQTSEKGYSSIRQISSGEVMHSVNDPYEEARQLYVEQSRLAERAKLPARTRDLGAATGGSSAQMPPLVIWDVGLGAATNAMMALNCLEQLGREHELRPIEIVSFENDLDSLKLTLRHPPLFPHIKHPAPHVVLRDGVWESKALPIRWKLHEGDFTAFLDAHLAGGAGALPAPDLIFYDPFSYKTDSDLWTLPAFQRLFRACQGRPVEIFTYSASTAVRSAILGAGFWVAKGRGTGPKAETTIALTGEARARFKPEGFLGKEWLEKWERSGAKFPRDLSPSDEETFSRRIREHAQFA